MLNHEKKIILNAERQQSLLQYIHHGLSPIVAQVNDKMNSIFSVNFKDEGSHKMCNLFQLYHLKRKICKIYTIKDKTVPESPNIHVHRLYEILTAKGKNS